MAYNPNANGRSYSRNNSNDATGFNTDLNDKSVYLLDHLATFTINKSSGILYPADGMRKLLQMEKTKGIWSQKMHLCIDRQWILILDYDNGKIIERFPASAIQEPTAFTSNDPNEIYSNILVFIVGGESRSHSEMHIFQCQSISAIHLVEDIKQMRNGKMITKSVEPSVISSLSSNSKQNQQQAPSTVDYNQGQSPELNFGLIHDDSSSTTSEKFEREVNVLNHCFDDIEKFIARLQTIAAALQDAQNRRRRSKKLDVPVDETRTRPPHEMEFIDIFAKFKLAFNLLGRLKSNIHDPNAPELVHFLFTPLALIVDSANQTYLGQNVPAGVVKPLLSREAINLLTNCITSKETELWHSLGNAWVMPKDTWKEKVPEYKPVFFDGWSPDFPLDDEPETAAPSPSSLKDNVKDIQVQSALAQLAASTEEYDSDFEDSPVVVPMDRKSVVNGNSRKSFVSADFATNVWLEELEARDAKIVQVTYPRTANNEKELTVVRGEYLEILDDSRKWWRARNIQGRVAHVPHTIVAQQLQHAEDLESSSYDGDVFNTYNEKPHYGSILKSNKPTNYFVEEQKQPPTPPPLPPPTLRSTKSIEPISFNRQSSSASRKSSINEPKGDDMQAELKNVLALFRENRRNWDAVKTPEIFIQQTSNPAQVQQWLKAKGFSDNVTTKLHGLSGNELFALKRATLEDYCGVEEGKRLSSQITIQRNVSGYKTTRSSELLAILAKARAKSDQQDELL
ncbi:unnamed protein product [Diamesa tonsa]